MRRVQGCETGVGRRDDRWKGKGEKAYLRLLVHRFIVLLANFG